MVINPSGSLYAGELRLGCDPPGSVSIPTGVVYERRVTDPWFIHFSAAGLHLVTMVTCG